MKKLTISMLLVGLVLCAIAVAEPAPKVGSEVPNFELPTLNGQLLPLPKTRAGKKTILTFFTSWSQPCQAELKGLKNLLAEKKEGLVVLAVSFDKKLKDLKAFAAKADLPFPILHDKKLSSIDNFQILIIPTTFCINQDGIIERIFVDYDDNVKKAIEEWLAVRSPGLSSEARSAKEGGA